MTGHDQGKITGRLIAAGRVAWQKFGKDKKDEGYVFLKNGGFALKIDENQMSALGITMDAISDCVKQLDEMGDVVVAEKIRENSGPTHAGLVLTSKVDPRLSMVVSMESSNQDDTDLGVAWFLDIEGLKSEMGNEAVPERSVTAPEMDAVGPARENAADKSEKEKKEMGENVDFFGMPLMESTAAWTTVTEASERYSLKDLKAMPTLTQGQSDDLKVDDGQTRVWLARTGVEDGEKYDNRVTVEKFKNGRWVTADEYMAESKSSKKKPLKENVEYLSDSELSAALDAIADALSQKGFIVSSTGSEIQVWKKGQKKLGFHELTVGFAVRSPGAKHLSGVDVMLTWSHTGKEDQQIDHDVQVGFDSEGEVKSISELASHLEDSFLTGKSKKTEGAEVVSETGEPDGEYDHALYDAITNAIKKKTGLDASHQEFDKYQGVAIDVSKKGKKLTTLWTIDGYVQGKAKKDSAKYSKAELISDGETVSATSGDYFMLKPEEKVGELLVLTRLDGTTRKIRNPKKKDLPADGEVRTTITYEGDPSDVLVLWPDAEDKDTRLEVIVSPDRKKVDLGDVAPTLKAIAMMKKEAVTESIESMLGVADIKPATPQLRELLKTGTLVESKDLQESKGSGWGDLKPGSKVKGIGELSIGDIALEKSNQFGAKNVIKVTAHQKDKVRAVFVDPKDVTKKRLPDDREFVIWDFDLEGGSMELYHTDKVKESNDDQGEKEMSESKTNQSVDLFEEVDFFGLPKFITESEAKPMKAGSALAKPAGKEGTAYGEKDGGVPEFVGDPDEKDKEVKAGAAKLGGDKTGMAGPMSAKTSQTTKPIPGASKDSGEAKLPDSKIKTGDAKDGVGDHVEGDGGESDDQQTAIKQGQVKPGKVDKKPELMAEAALLREARMKRIKEMHDRKIEEVKKERAKKKLVAESGKMLPKGAHSPKKKVNESEKIKDLDSREKVAMVKEAIKPAAGEVMHGFDLTDIPADKFKEVLKELGIDADKEAPRSREDGFKFAGKDITINTANNPLTGEYYSGGRSPEVGYASYMGITGSPEKVATAVSLIKKHATSIKGESPGERQFI